MTTIFTYLAEAEAQPSTVEVGVFEHEHPTVPPRFGGKMIFLSDTPVRSHRIVHVEEN